MICFSKLNLNINIHLLQQEVNNLLTRQEWLPHYNLYDYEGSWQVLPLRNATGKIDHPYADLLDNTTFTNTDLLNSLPQTSAVLQEIKCEKLSVRLLNLIAGSSIKPHRDIELAFEHGEARLHIPILTNSGVEFYVQENRIIMNEGECWYINANIPHHVANKGNTNRIHLVIDCKVNDWLTNLITKGEKKTIFLKKDRETTLHIIKSLHSANTDYTNKLAAQMEKELNANEVMAKMLDFILEIGLQYHLENINEDTFLPGLKLSGGALIIDTEKLLYPGDILHEAGHLACMPPTIRKGMSDNLPVNDLHNGGEMMAIGWSYAACIHLGIDPKVVFHEHGYKDASASLIENFKESRFIAVPLLQWLGMTYDEKQAEIHGLRPYPAMQKWLCTERPG